MRRLTLALLFVLALAFIPAASASTVAADATVAIIDFGFSPAIRTIGVGDSVTWTNNDSFDHTVTSDQSAWDSRELEPNKTTTVSFASPGRFPYHCAFHPGMTGTIVVIAPQVYLPVVQEQAVS